MNSGVEQKTLKFRCFGLKQNTCWVFWHGISIGPRGQAPHPRPEPATLPLAGTIADLKKSGDRQKDDYLGFYTSGSLPTRRKLLCGSTRACVRVPATSDPKKPAVGIATGTQPSSIPPLRSMPLPLTDSRWGELQSSYNGTGDIITWLAQAYEQGGMSEERVGDLINEVQHQGDTSSAMYAVATHLIELAREASPNGAITLLTHAGLIYADSDAPRAVSCPVFLREDFLASASVGANMLARLLPSAADFESFKWAVAGLAGFVGHHSFGRFLEGLDLYEGQFHHVLLSEPFPKEE